MAGGAPTRGIFLAAPEEIRAGKTSDIYFIRTLEVLKKARKDRTKVVLETTVQSLPNGWPWAVFLGLTEALNLPRVALVATVYDEKAESMIGIEAIKGLAGVRLDAPSSRRGNFPAIVQEVRWELDLRGRKDAKIFVSGGRH